MCWAQSTRGSGSRSERPPRRPARPTAMITLDDVLLARERIRGGIYQSPCVESIPLSQLTGARIWCGHGVFTHNLTKISALAA